MPLPTSEDVCQGFLIYWEVCSNGYLVTQIPKSRVFMGMVAEGIDWPNAKISAEMTSQELMSGPVCLVKYLVSIDAMTYDTDGGKLTAALQSGFASNSYNPKIDIANATSVINVKSLGGKVEPQGTDMRRDGNDLKKIMVKYEVLLQGDREWA